MSQLNPKIREAAAIACSMMASNRAMPCTGFVGTGALDLSPAVHELVWDAYYCDWFDNLGLNSAEVWAQAEARIRNDEI